MGDPKRQRKKYSRPSHPWQKERIEQEASLIKEYGLKNKKELWKVASTIKNFARQARKLAALETKQAEKEKKQLLDKLYTLNLVSRNARLDDALGLSTRDLLERRLQSIVFRKGLAKSMRQARQFIVHGHIVVGDKKITSPGFFVPSQLEDSVAFAKGSALADVQHPERIVLKKKGNGNAEKKAEKKEENAKEK